MVENAAEKWSAVAGVASACAAIVSLIGVRYTSIQARRSADAAEEVVRREAKPVLCPTLEPEEEGGSEYFSIRFTNVGRGLAISMLSHLIPNTIFYEQEMTAAITQMNTADCVHIDMAAVHPDQSFVVRGYRPGQWLMCYSDADGENNYSCAFRLSESFGTKSLDVLAYKRRDKAVRYSKSRRRWNRILHLKDDPYEGNSVWLPSDMAEPKASTQLSMHLKSMKEGIAAFWRSI